MTSLPLKPLYTQSGGASDSTAGDVSPLAYWSLAATVAFTLFVYAFEGSLDARQKAAYQKTTFPKELEMTVSKIDSERAKEPKKQDDKDDKAPLLEQLQAKFKSSQAYGLDKINFGMISSTYDTFESVAFLLLGFLPYVWDKSVTIGQTYFGWTVDHEIKITLIFLLITTIVGTITSLPFELYSTFQIERKHGFNKQTLSLFFSDKVKSFILSCVIGGPFVALLLKIIKMGGEYFYIYVWGFMFVFSVFMKLFVMDGSKRSSHSNAFMFGFGSNKRIGALDLVRVLVDQRVVFIGLHTH